MNICSHHYFTSLILSICFLFLISCTQMITRKKVITPYLEKSQYLTAINSLERKKKEVYPKRNRLLYHLDIGTLYHYAQKHDSSNTYLLKALEIYNDLYTRSITVQAFSSLLNPNIAPYRSYPYEIIAAHQMVSLNFRALNQPDESLVETRRAQVKFDTWQSEQPEKYYSDGSFHFFSFLHYFASQEPQNGLVSLYHSIDYFQKQNIPLPHFVAQEGLNLFSRYQRQNDLKLLQDFNQNSHFKSMTQSPTQDSAQIIIIGYAGKGPLLSEEFWSGTYFPFGVMTFHHYDYETNIKKQFTIPWEQFNDHQENNYEFNKKNKQTLSKHLHISFALPKVILPYSQTRHFKITSNLSNSTSITESLTDYHQLAEQNLQNNKNSIIFKTILRAIFKTTIAQVTKKTLEHDNFFVNLLTGIFVSNVLDATETADTRNLFALPKTLEVSKMMIPAKPQKIKIYPIDEKGRIISSFKKYSITPSGGKTYFLFTHSSI